MMASLYKIGCTIYGHNADVRGVSPSPLSPLGILSSSRDYTARIWVPDSDGKGYHQAQCLEGHTNFVSCVAAVGPSEENPDGLVFTGCSDKLIRVFSPKLAKPVLELKGHDDTVCCLVAGKFNMVVSGSWDKTARVWVYNKTDSTSSLEANNVMTLSGHDASVWAVLILQQGLMATGSADKTIKLWKAGKCLKTLTGHDDCVRGLAQLSACQFLSCANDATVRRWMTTGECVQVYYGHTGFVYSVYVLPGEAEFVTSGEDRSLRVWDIEKKEPVQNIALPAQSAWDVAALENGDIMTGLSDTTIRVFSRSADRIASPQEIAAYEMELSSAKISKSGNDLGDIDLSTTPGPEVLEAPGKKDGQVQMVRSGEKVEAYQWSEAETRWVKVGDVVGGKKGKSTYNGREYDFVFDVDIQEGMPSLKLPYNLNEDAWWAAQRFIDDNELSQDFLEQIATFILDNTKEARKNNPQQTQGPAYTDPFTGGGRYIPHDNEETGGSGEDPFTGGGRYIPSGSSNVVTNGGDPFTSSGRYVPDGESEVKLGGGAAADPMINPDRYIPGDEEEAMDTTPVKPVQTQVQVNEYFPKEGFITFENANIDAILGKVKSFSETCGPLLEEELESLKSLTISMATPDGEQLDLLWKVLRWPAENVFPALDVLRLACLKHPNTCKVLCTGTSEDDQRPSQLLEMLCSFISASGRAKHVSANRLFSLRTLCNLFNTPDGAAFLTAGNKDIFAALSVAFSAGLTSDHSPTSSAPFHGNKNVQIAAATLLLNFAVLCSSASEKELSPLVRKLSSATRSSSIELCIVHLVAGAETLDSEAIFRYLVCMGTLLSGKDASKLTKEAKELGAEKVVETTGALYFSVPKVYGSSITLSALLNAV